MKERHRVFDITFTFDFCVKLCFKHILEVIIIGLRIKLFFIPTPVQNISVRIH